MGNKPTIGITGAGGHIGSQLTRYFTAKGFDVIALTRKIDPIENTSVRKYDLTENVSDELLTGIDVLIHCAFVSREQDDDAAQINYNGSRLLFDACKKQGVRKIIFFSTVTADENAVSGYARSKYAIGQLLNPNTDFMIRCSMVAGAGGLFRKILDYGITHTFIPLIGDGQQVVQVVAIDDVVRYVEEVIIRDLAGVGVLANEESLTYRQLFSTIADVYRRRIIFVRVPVALLRIMIRLSKLLGIRTRASEENVQGIQTLRAQKPLLLLPSYLTLQEKLIELRDAS